MKLSGFWLAALVLAGAVGLSFGIHAPLLGFYHDDWAFLELGLRAGGFWPAVREFASAGYLSRPVEIIQFPLFIRLGGLDASAYHGILLTLHYLSAALFFVLLRDLLGSARLALLAAALASIHPSSSIMRIWFASSPQTLAIALVLASLVVFQRSLDSRHKPSLFFSQALYLAGTLCYESPAFLPLLLAGGLAGKSWAQGHRLKDALLRSTLSLWPYGLSLALALVYQRFAGAALGQANPKTLGFSFSHAIKVFGAGLECLTNRAMHLCWKSVPGFWADSSMAAIGLWLAVAVIGALVLACKEDLRGIPVRSALGAAVFGFIGAYLPYALSATYMPQVFGFMSRTNGVGALAGGLILALLASLLSKQPRIQRAFLGLVVLAFTLANWQINREYAKLWQDQQQLLSSVSRMSEVLPKGATILLDQSPRQGPALFAGHYDFSASLRLKTKRPDLSGDLLGAPSAPQGPGVFVFSEKDSIIKPLQMYTR
ncbi:MAG: hypothetical protein HY924_17105 [Elusimicrobia bacterium]|nr:hypothetical protein [Elusimicrobiota bacterium]